MRGMPTNDIGLPRMVMGICVVSRIFPVSLCTIMAINTKCSAQLNQDTFLKEFCSYSIGDRSPLAV